MCRYESRALSASVMGNKSFRFRISALIWSRRALDAPLVERYIVAGCCCCCCCGELSRNSSRCELERVASGELFKPRLESLSPEMCYETGCQRVEEKKKLRLLDFHLISVFSQRKVSKPSPVSCLPSALAPPQRPARMLGVCPPARSAGESGGCGRRLALKSGTRKSG